MVKVMMTVMVSVKRWQLWWWGPVFFSLRQLAARRLLTILKKKTEKPTCSQILQFPITVPKSKGNWEGEEKTSANHPLHRPGLHQPPIRPTTVYTNITIAYTNHSLHQPPFTPSTSYGTPTTGYTNHPSFIPTNRRVHPTTACFTPRQVYANPTYGQGTLKTTTTYTHRGSYQARSTQITG